MQNKYYHEQNIHILNKDRLQSSLCMPPSLSPNPLPQTQVPVFGVWQGGATKQESGLLQRVGEGTEFLERNHQ